MGFIGSHLVKYMVNTYPNYNIINYDSLTYASNPYFLSDIADKSNYTFVEGNICDEQMVFDTFVKYNITDVIHLAAESHVDNSILNPLEFIKTNVLGTATLLNISRDFFTKDSCFYHISTDEVYGSLGSTGLFTEETPYNPRSPYSASKASSDHFVRAFYETYGLPILISNCSNNYGPNQHIEKLIPLTINRIFKKQPIPIYGNGLNIRDWLYVNDHILAIDTIFHNGKIGETYNIGSNNEMTNIDLVQLICSITENILSLKENEAKNLITYVSDRLGHDKRYAIDYSKLHNDLDWSPKTTLSEGLNKTIYWYIDNLRKA